MSSPGATAGVARISLEHVVETPENVVLTYQLAGPAVRLGAFLIDLLIRAMIFVGALIVGGIVLGRVLPSLTVAMVLVLYFVLDWLYFAICEGFFRGKTPGKHLYGLRVIHVAGYPISLWEAVVRNFVRAMDNVPLIFIGWYGVAWLTMLVCGKFRRLGDMVAQTIVVEERRVSVPREPIILEKIQPLPRNELGGWVPSPATLALIEEFLGRRGVLTYVRGHAIAIGLARVLATRLDYKGPPQQVEEYPMAFLARVYATFYRVDDESEDLDAVGRRPRSPEAAVVLEVTS